MGWKCFYCLAMNLTEKKEGYVLMYERIYVRYIYSPSFPLFALRMSIRIWGQVFTYTLCAFLGSFYHICVYLVLLKWAMLMGNMGSYGLSLRPVRCAMIGVAWFQPMLPLQMVCRCILYIWVVESTDQFVRHIVFQMRFFRNHAPLGGFCHYPFQCAPLSFLVRSVALSAMFFALTWFSICLL